MMSQRVSLSACGVAMLIAGCGSEAVTFTDPAAVFEVESGDQFTIVLESNPSTGYSWELEVEPLGYIVTHVRTAYVEPDTDLVGAAGRQEFTFEAVGDGTAVIQLWYVRPFDDPPEPADRAEFEVRVGNAISVTELLATSPEEPMYVAGILFDDGSGLRLCGVLGESSPPQCLGDSIFISNPESVDVEFTSLANLRWTYQAVVLLGELDDGEFRLRLAGQPLGS